LQWQSNNEECGIVVGGSRGGGPKICHLTSVHWVEDTRILRRECRSLAEAGYDVTLIARQPAIEPVRGVRVVTVGDARNRFDRMTRVAARVLRTARRERPDICHLHDPELLWVGLLLKLSGHRVVYDVHEDVPKQIMNKFWIHPWARRILSWLMIVVESVCRRLFDAIVAATPTIAEKFPAAKTVVVQNFPERAIAERGSSPTDSVTDEARRYAFAYAGGLNVVQGVREIMAVAARLPEDASAVVAGWFDSDDVERGVKASAGWRKVDYIGGVSHARVIEAFRSANCGLVIDHPISNYLDSYSTKMFEYMACGIPVVCSDFPLWARIVGSADCGIAVDPLDPPAAADAVAQLWKDPEEARRLGENGRRTILERFNWEAEFAKLDALYQRLTE
jgi:glycosyltransferase involved in cell wall biosynthesis